MAPNPQELLLPRRARSAFELLASVHAATLTELAQRHREADGDTTVFEVPFLMTEMLARQDLVVEARTARSDTAVDDFKAVAARAGHFDGVRQTRLQYAKGLHRVLHFARQGLRTQGDVTAFGSQMLESLRFPRGAIAPSLPVNWPFLEGFSKGDVDGLHHVNARLAEQEFDLELALKQQKFPQDVVVAQAELLATDVMRANLSMAPYLLGLYNDHERLSEDETAIAAIIDAHRSAWDGEMTSRNGHWDAVFGEEVPSPVNGDGVLGASYTAQTLVADGKVLSVTPTIF